MQTLTYSPNDRSMYTWMRPCAAAYSPVVLGAARSRARYCSVETQLNHAQTPKHRPSCSWIHSACRPPTGAPWSGSSFSSRCTMPISRLRRERSKRFPPTPPELVTRVRHNFGVKTMPRPCTPSHPGPELHKQMCTSRTATSMISAQALPHSMAQHDPACPTKHQTCTDAALGYLCSQVLHCGVSAHGSSRA